MSRRRIAVVGAGPGGLTAAMILARRGFEVTVFEKRGVVGGRNSPIRLGDYTFDTGPTFLMMNFILEDVFREAGRDVGNYLKFRRLDPMYRLRFEDGDLMVYSDRDRMAAEIERRFPGNQEGLSRFLAREQVKFERMFPCLQMPYLSLTKLLHPNLLKAAPHLDLTRSLYGNLGRYFGPEKLRLAFTFQAKYLGMSPWHCPAAFTILSYVEHVYGIYHVIGGLNCISQAMAKVVREHGGQVRLDTPVRRVIVERGAATGVELEGGERIEADDVVLNADFGHAVCNLFDEGDLKRWRPGALRKKRFSCSTFMLYLGLGKRYELPHHNIAFARDYLSNVNDIFDDLRLPRDISFYVQNASVTDSTLAPDGKSTLYVLVPVPNQRSGINWAREASGFRDLVLDALCERMDMSDLREHIEVEKVITPDDWAAEHDVHIGATFNLAHNIGQMLFFRPHNRFEDVGRCYLVGGGTHPGSGLPTIYESGRIAANLICDAWGVAYEAPSPLAAKSAIHPS